MSDKNLNEWLFADMEDLIDCDYVKESDGENKMADNEIIKALENEIRSTEYVDSEYCDGVDLTLIKSAVALINCQKSEIERLKECPKCIYEYDGNTTEYCIQGPCPNFKTVEQIKSEAYKEFAEKLKKRFYLCAGRCVVDVYHIDSLVKEMVGDTE